LRRRPTATRSSPTRRIRATVRFCAYGAASGYKAAIDPAAFSVVDGKLYLNYDRTVQKEWKKDVPGFIAKANKNWPTVSTQTKVIE
jgi:hypothetical protein